jgi:hypothetical protein
MVPAPLPSAHLPLVFINQKYNSCFQQRGEGRCRWHRHHQERSKK